MKRFQKSSALLMASLLIASPLANSLGIVAHAEEQDSGFESILRTRFERIFSRFRRARISLFQSAIKPKPFDG